MNVKIKKLEMRLIKKIIFACAITVLSVQAAVAEGIIFQDLTLQEGLDKAKKENKKVFIDVYATWCGPCKYLSSNVFVDENLGAFMNEHFVSLKIDGEKGDGLQLMRDFSLNSYPTMLFLNPEMDLLKKIVGVVGADEIEAAGNELIFPETTLIYQMEKKYDEGNRDRAFLAEYVVELLNREEDPELIVASFLEKYPDPNLNENNEFLVFCVGITDRDHPSMKSFLEDLKALSEIHGEFVLTKLNMILMGVVDDAVAANDSSLIAPELDKVYPFYAAFEEEDAVVSRDEMLGMMEEMFNDAGE